MTNNHLPNQTQVEFGYTPANLRYIRKAHNLTQKDVAIITGIKDFKAVNRWEADTQNPTHADMPHVRWEKLKKHLNINEDAFKMTVGIFDIGVPNMRRVVSGSLASSLMLDWTKPLAELQKDVQLALETLSETQGFFKNLIMFGAKNVIVYRGNNHIDIVDDGKGSLNWLFVADTYIDADDD